MIAEASEERDCLFENQEINLQIPQLKFYQDQCLVRRRRGKKHFPQKVRLDIYN
jgi:hypothetical protein